MQQAEHQLVTAPRRNSCRLLIASAGGSTDPACNQPQPRRQQSKSLTPCFCRRSLDRDAVMTFLRTWEGAAKCALRHLRRAEDTAALNFIAAAKTKKATSVNLCICDKQCNNHQNTLQHHMHAHPAPRKRLLCRCRHLHTSRALIEARARSVKKRQGRS